MELPGVNGENKDNDNSGMDSYNDEDEIEDENRDPATITINHSSSVTRAGAQRGNFGPARKLNPVQGGTNLNTPMHPILEIGTEETVMQKID